MRICQKRYSATNNTLSMRIAFNFCKHAMAVRFAEISEDALLCLLEEKNAENIKRSLISE